MEANHFDALARSLSAPSPRRGLWRGIAASTLGLVAARLPGAVTARKKRKRKKRRNKQRKACANGTETCLGQCVAPCTSGLVRNPLTCGCCQRNDGLCSPGGGSAECCSGTCGLNAGTCVGRDVAQPCEFAAQCASGACSSVGLCVFAAPS